MEVSLLQKKLNTQAEEKLVKEVQSIFPINWEQRKGFDLANTWINKDKLNKRSDDRVDTIIRILIDTIIDANRQKYIEMGTEEFLNKVDKIEIDLTQIRSELNL